MSKPKKSISPLEQAQLSCKCGRDALDGVFYVPAHISRLEYAMFNLLHAVEEIAKAMMPKGEG